MDFISPVIPWSVREIRQDGYIADHGIFIWTQVNYRLPIDVFLQAAEQPNRPDEDVMPTTCICMG